MSQRANCANPQVFSSLPPYFSFFWFFFFFFKRFIYFMHECSICMYTWRPVEGISSQYRWLWATTWLPGIEFKTFGRTGGALNYWTISPAFFCFFQNRVSLCSPACLGTCWPQTQRSACLCHLSAGINGVCYHHLVLVVFLDSVLYSSGFPTNYVWEADLELLIFCLPLPKAVVIGVCHYSWFVQC